MNTIGIIAEYNPFHNGHLHQIKTIRMKYSKARIIALMSGSFTQRGCPAILDKWQRAHHAILGGVDLVLELPMVFAVRSAQDFAHGAVSLLSRLGIADGIAFGAESDSTILKRAAASMNAIEFQKKLHFYIQDGLSYAAALSRMIAETCNIEEDLLKKPNNILAIEYLRALNNNTSKIKPLILERVGAAYHDTELHDTYASASAIRLEISSSKPSIKNLAKVLPANTLDTLIKARQKETLPDASLLLRPLLARVEYYSTKELQEIYSINEGLENRLLRAAFNCRTLNDLLSQCCSKRYPRSRIQRLVIYLMLHLRKTDIHAFDTLGPLYARILAFNRTGKSLLHEIKQKSPLPLVSKMSHFLKDAALKRLPQENPSLKNMLAFDIHATELRRLCSPQITAHGEDFRRSPIFISEAP